MKYVVIVILFLTVFIIGLNMSDYSYSVNYLLEQEKDKFEEQIIIPSNNYKPKSFIPKDNLVSKTAHKLEDTLDKAIDKFFDIIKNI